MKMFSNCSGECAVCSVGGGCLAGHGDDDYSPANKEQLIKRLDEGSYPLYRNLMIKTLRKEFDYLYVEGPKPKFEVGEIIKATWSDKSISYHKIISIENTVHGFWYNWIEDNLGHTGLHEHYLSKCESLRIGE